MWFVVLLFLLFLGECLLDFVSPCEIGLFHFNFDVLLFHIDVSFEVVLFHFEHGAQSEKDGQEWLNCGHSVVRHRVNSSEYEEDHGHQWHAETFVEFFPSHPFGNKNGNNCKKPTILEYGKSEGAKHTLPKDIEHLGCSSFLDLVEIMVLPTVALNGPCTINHVTDKFLSCIVATALFKFQSFSLFRAKMLANQNDDPYAESYKWIFPATSKKQNRVSNKVRERCRQCSRDNG